MSKCPSHEELQLYLMNDLPKDEQARIWQHLHECADCRRVMEETNQALKALRESPVPDPGEAFTNAVMAKAPRTRRVFHLPKWLWPRTLAWGMSVAAVVAILLLWTTAHWAGTDRVTVAVPPTVIAGGRFVLPVQVNDKDGRPVAGSRVTVATEKVAPFAGRTDASGLCAATLTLPEGKDAHTLTVDVRTASGDQELTVPVTATRADTVYLSTDKPLYQPGQMVHLRALVLHPTALTPITGEPVTFTAKDGRGTLIFKQQVNTSDWGVASVDLPLDAEITPGDYTLKAETGDNADERTVTVSRYTLPKFKVTITTDRGWYLPGQVVTGTVSAVYTFGQPCAGAHVRVEATMAGETPALPAGLAVGTAAADGSFPFTLRLPDTLFGTGEQGGNAVVTLRAAITDTAGHLQEISRDYPVAREAILVTVLPESGSPVVGVENTFYVVTSYPDGSPARATVSVDAAGLHADVRTDGQGIGSFPFTPKEGTVKVYAEAVDADGLRGTYNGTLSSPGARQSLDDQFSFTNRGVAFMTAPTVLLRANKAAYHVGDVAHISALAPGQGGSLFVEVTRNKQPVAGSVLTLVNGAAHGDLPITNDISGLITLQVFVLTGGSGRGQAPPLPDAQYAQGSRTLYVQPAEALKVGVEGLKTGRPGQPQDVILRVTTPDGHGVKAAVGVSGVDEAVYAIEDQHPGLARVFFLMREELNDPTFECHTDALPARLQGAPTADDATAPGEAARVAMAAYAAQGTVLVGRYNEGDASERNSRVGEILWHTIAMIGVALFVLLGLMVHASGWAFQKREEGKVPGFRIAGHIILTLFLGASAVISVLVSSDMPFFGVLFAGLYWIAGTNYHSAVIHHRKSSTLAIFVTACILIMLAGILLPTLGRSGKMESLSEPAPSVAPAPTTTREITPPLQQQTEVVRASNAVSTAATLRVREYFPETLVWLPEVVTDESGAAKVTLPAADSITTWRLGLLANTRDGRLGSADMPYTVMQDFFVDIDAPVQVTVGDTLKLPVAVHNYTKGPLDVTLTLEATDGLSSGGTDKSVYPTVQTVSVGAGETTSAQFPLTADAAGEGTVTVRAVAGTGSTVPVPASTGDAIKRSIRVVPQGTQVAVTRGGVLRGTLTMSVDLPADADVKTSDLTLRLFPGSQAQVLAGLDGLLQRPYGCFEQTTMCTYPNIMVLRYLKESKSTDVAALARAQNYVLMGYQRLLGFEVAGSGGFSLFGEAPQSFGLTAIGLAEFQDMAQVQTVDPALLARMAAWLKAHWDDASPEEKSLAVAPLAAAGDEDLVTAWVTKRATVDPAETARLLQAALTLDLPVSKNLERALVSLAAKSDDGKARVWHGMGNDLHWADGAWMGQGDVEATGLAVQALAAAGGHSDLVQGGCDYLIATRAADGGWNTTGATVQALKAILAAGGANAKGTVAVTVNGHDAGTLTMKGDGVAVTQSLTQYLQPGANTVELVAPDGVTPACQLVLREYRPWRAAEDGGPPSPVTVTYDRTQLMTGDTVTATARLLLPAPAQMAMADLAVPPGFAVLTEDLDALKAAGRLARYDLTGTQIVLYLHDIPADTPVEFTYRLRALFPIRATVRPSAAYPYYEPERRYESAAGSIEIS